MEKLIRVAINDLKLVFRDASLRIFLVVPLINLLVARYGFPYVIESYEVLRDYLPILLMVATMQGSLIFGFIYSMVLIDEKDANVARVYGVLPVSKSLFVIVRLIAPFLFSAFATFLLLIAQPFYKLPIIANIIYSMLSGLVAPVMILFVATVASNKIEGMTWQKLFNLPVSLPLMAFFLPAWVSFVFGILPTHWAYQGFNSMIVEQNPSGYFFVGFIYSVLLIALLARKFSRNHFN